MVRAISDNDSTNPSITSFTASSATQMLPLVSRIVDDLLRLDHSIQAQREQLSGIDKLSSTIDHTDYKEELSDIRGSLVHDQQEFETVLTELTSLGVSPHLPFDGSVDFPTQLNRRHVRLCWQPGDERVEYWHEIGENRERRQVEPARSASE